MTYGFIKAYDASQPQGNLKTMPKVLADRALMQHLFLFDGISFVNGLNPGVSVVRIV